MRNSILMSLCLCIMMLLNSCASVNPTKEDAFLLIIVQNKTNSFISHKASLTLSDKKGVLKLHVKTPYVLVKLPSTGELSTIEYNIYQKRKSFQLIKFKSEIGSITIFPQKLSAYSQGTSVFEKITTEDRNELLTLIETENLFTNIPIIWSNN